MLALFEVLCNGKRELQCLDDYMRRILGAQSDHSRFYGPVKDLAISSGKNLMRLGIKGFRIEKKSIVVINNVGNLWRSI